MRASRLVDVTRPGDRGAIGKQFEAEVIASAEFLFGIEGGRCKIPDEKVARFGIQEGNQPRRFYTGERRFADIMLPVAGETIYIECKATTTPRWRFGSITASQIEGLKYLVRQEIPCFVIVLFQCPPAKEVLAIQECYALWGEEMVIDCERWREGGTSASYNHTFLAEEVTRLAKFYAQPAGANCGRVPWCQSLTRIVLPHGMGWDLRPLVGEGRTIRP